MSRPVTVDEVTRVMLVFQSDKAPGPDGFTAGFYAKVWPIIGPKEAMGVDGMNSITEAGELGEFENQKSSDMERFSHLIEKDMSANSRITRNLSRKGSIRGVGENKINSMATTCNERDTSMLASSPRATTLHGGMSMPEKAMVVGVGPNDHSQVHHQITINNGNINSTATESSSSSKLSGRRFSFRRSSPTTWIIDPRRILFFFATLSCVGTILLIYFTLSMGKLNGDENNLNQQ